VRLIFCFEIFFIFYATVYNAKDTNISKKTGRDIIFLSQKAK